MEITFNQLPSMVALILHKVEQLEKNHLTNLSGFGLGPEKPITVEEASAFLNMPVNTIYSLTSSKKIPCFKPGKNLLFYKSELTEWVKESRQKTVAEIQAEARKGVRRG